MTIREHTSTCTTIVDQNHTVGRKRIITLRHARASIAIGDPLDACLICITLWRLASNDVLLDS